MSVGGEWDPGTNSTPGYEILRVTLTSGVNGSPPTTKILVLPIAYDPRVGIVEGLTNDPRLMP